MSPKSVAWWQRAWDLHSRSRVRVRACTSCKSLGQPGFYSLIWAHKVRFPGSEVSSNPKKKNIIFSMWIWNPFVYILYVSKEKIMFFQCEIWNSLVYILYVPKKKVMFFQCGIWNLLVYILYVPKKKIIFSMWDKKNFLV
jgi:hypothetical protein